MADPRPEPLDAVELARGMIGGRTAAFGWGGRIRVVMPNAGPRARLEAALSAPAYRMPTRAVRSVRALWHALLPSSVTDGPPSSLRDPLPACLDGLRPASIIVGTPGPRRSLVVRWIDARGRPTVALKLAAAPQAALGIERERLALEDPGLTGKAPALLWAGTIDGREALATAHVTGRPGSLGGRGVNEASSVLPAPSPASPRLPAELHPWIVRTLATAGLPSALLDDLDGEWPLVRMHGDLAPWNLIRRRSGAVVAIDWEASEPDGLPGIDLAHHVMTTALAVRRSNAARIVDAACRAVSHHHRVSESAARALVALAAGSVAHLRRDEANEAAARRWDQLCACALDRR